MAQKLATLTGIVKMTGHREKSLREAYEQAAPRSRKMINQLTGRPFTIFGELSIIAGDKNDFIAQFSFKRESIKGNFDNDLKEFVERAANKGNKNRRINVDILRSKRVELE